MSARTSGLVVALVAALVLAVPAYGSHRPSLRIETKPPRYTKKTKVRFRFSSRSRHVSFHCKLSWRHHRSRFRRCRSGRTYRRLRNRTYAFRVFARHGVGKRSRIRRRRFTVDTIKPRVRIRSGPALNTRSTSASFTFSGSDRSPVRLECRFGLTAVDWQRCRSPRSFSGLPDGDQRFQVRAVDAARNRSGAANYGWNVYTGPPRPHFSTTPRLVIPFAWETRDNVVRCTGQPVKVDLGVPPGWTASVAGGAFRDGAFAVDVPLARNHRFTVTFRSDAGGPDQVFSVRCLPSDFPKWTFTRTRTGGPAYFMVERGNQYIVIYDSHGVPAWWAKAGGTAHNFELLPDGTIGLDPVPHAADQVGTYEVRDLENHLVREVDAKNLPTDIHELLRLPNGNYLLGGQTHESGVNLTSIGGPASGTILGFEIHEIAPNGDLEDTWWQTQGHISTSETPSRWWGVIHQPDDSYDTQHWNSVEPTDGNTKMLLSFRHLDAVYKVDRASGNIQWKLGGTSTPQSLTVQDDPLGADPLVGQHDARLLPDGTVSAFDDGTFAGRPPRVVRYEIDETAKTATLVESFTDPELSGATFCCGSARRLSDSWLVGWGGRFTQLYVGAYDFSGQRIWKLETPANDFSYRANPVPPGALSQARLRSAMDGMYP